MHGIHIFGFCSIGVMTALAIASTLTPWTHAHMKMLIPQGFKETTTYTLWGYKTETPLGDDSSSWESALNSDTPICPEVPGSPTASSWLHDVRIAQFASIACAAFCVAYFVCCIVYAAGKFRNGGLLLIPALLTAASAAATFGAWLKFYNRTGCMHDLCEEYVKGAMAHGAETAACGPYAGLFLVWAAVAIGILGTILMLLKKPEGLDVARSALPTEVALMNAHAVQCVPHPTAGYVAAPMPAAQPAPAPAPAPSNDEAAQRIAAMQREIEALKAQQQQRPHEPLYEQPGERSASTTDA